jgi:hypothetical protein
MSNDSIHVINGDGAILGTVEPKLWDSLRYISEQTGLSLTALVEASLTLFIACTSATLGPTNFLPKPPKSDMD